MTQGLIDQTAIEKLRPRFYTANISIATQPPGVVPAGTMGRGSITVNNYPFFLKRFRAAILGANQIAVPTPIPSDFFQDGQFTLLWYIDNDQYMNTPMHAGAFVDPTGRPGCVIDLLAPIPVKPKQTLQIELMTIIQRVAGINIQCIFEGVEPR